MKVPIPPEVHIIPLLAFVYFHRFIVYFQHETLLGLSYSVSVKYRWQEKAQPRQFSLDLNLENEEQVGSSHNIMVGFFFCETSEFIQFVKIFYFFTCFFFDEIFNLRTSKCGHQLPQALEDSAFNKNSNIFFLF